MKLMGKLTKQSKNLSAAVSPRVGGGKVKDVVYGSASGESLVNADGVAVIPTYPTIPEIPVKGVESDKGVNLVNAQGIAIIPTPSQPTKTELYTLTQGGVWQTFTISDPYDGYMVDINAYGINKSFEFNPAELPDRIGGDLYTSACLLPTLNGKIDLNMGMLNNGTTIYISTNGAFNANNVSIKVYGITEV